MTGSFIREVYKGKTLGRILFNKSVHEHAHIIRGKVLDLAGGRNPSYAGLLPQNSERIAADILSDEPIDMNAVLPFNEGEFDTVLYFNALYIADDPQRTLSEIYRVLKPEGKLLLSVPFMYGEIPEPHDYTRFTKEGIERLLDNTGFKSIKVERRGGRWGSAANLLHSFWLFDTIRGVVYLGALLLDRVTQRFQDRHPAPMVYFAVASRV